MLKLKEKSIFGYLFGKIETVSSIIPQLHYL